MTDDEPIKNSKETCAIKQVLLSPDIGGTKPGTAGGHLCNKQKEP